MTGTWESSGIPMISFPSATPGIETLFFVGAIVEWFILGEVKMSITFYQEEKLLRCQHEIWGKLASEVGGGGCPAFHVWLITGVIWPRSADYAWLPEPLQIWCLKLCGRVPWIFVC